MRMYKNKIKSFLGCLCTKIRLKFSQNAYVKNNGNLYFLNIRRHESADHIW